MVKPSEPSHNSVRTAWVDCTEWLAHSLHSVFIDFDGPRSGGAAAKTATIVKLIEQLWLPSASECCHLVAADSIAIWPSRPSTMRSVLTKQVRIPHVTAPMGDKVVQSPFPGNTWVLLKDSNTID
jgi:hypothetical protein